MNVQYGQNIGTSRGLRGVEGGATLSEQDGRADSTEARSGVASDPSDQLVVTTSVAQQPLAKQREEIVEEIRPIR